MLQVGVTTAVWLEICLKFGMFWATKHAFHKTHFIFLTNCSHLHKNTRWIFLLRFRVLFWRKTSTKSRINATTRRTNALVFVQQVDCLTAGMINQWKMQILIYFRRQKLKSALSNFVVTKKSGTSDRWSADFSTNWFFHVNVLSKTKRNFVIENETNNSTRFCYFPLWYGDSKQLTAANHLN